MTEGNQTGNCDNHYLTFTHTARFRVNQILTEKKPSQDDLPNENPDNSYNASADFRICHNGESIVFKPFINWCQRKVDYELPVTVYGLCLGLHMVQSTIEEVQTAGIHVEVVCGSNGNKIIYHSWALTYSTFAHVFKMNCPRPREKVTFHQSSCPPRSALKLSQEGYLIDDGLVLAIKYELKFHRSLFDHGDKYNNIIGLMTHEPNDFDRFEFEELHEEVKNCCRFVLESSDGVRFCAHKNRLSFASEYFKGMFRGNPQNQQYNEVGDGKLKMEISAESLRQILAFIYMGSVDKDLNESSVVEIAKAGDKYLMNTLKTLCHSQLLTFVGLSTVSINRVIEYLLLAHETHLTELKKKCMDWLHDHWDTVKDEDDVKELMNDEEGKEIVWELVDYLMKK